MQSSSPWPGEIRAKIITNDFNLNKVAELQGVNVLNIQSAIQRPEACGSSRRSP